MGDNLLMIDKFFPTADYWAVLPAYLAMVLGVSWLSYRYVELRFMKASKRE